MSKEKQAEVYFIKKIMAGDLKPGEMLLPERALALEIGFSRPVIHRALIRLEEKGLVDIRPRKGVRILDYKLKGKLSALEPILNFERDHIQRDLNLDMLYFIKDNLKNMIMYFKMKEKVPARGILEADQDFFIWLKDMAIQTDNRLYVLLINEFEVGIKNVAKCLIENLWVLDQFIKIDHSLSDKKVEQALVLVEPLFEKIKILWLGDGV